MYYICIVIFLKCRNIRLFGSTEQPQNDETMEREELRTKVNDSLGGTQLTLSERTINEELDDVLETVTDDAQVDDAFVERITKRLKRMNGNLHADVSAESKKYKEQFEKDWKEKHPEGGGTKKDGDGGEEPEWFKKYREENDKKLQQYETERKEKETKEKKASVLKSLNEGIRKKFKEAGEECNEYILKNTIRDAEVNEDSDVEALIKSVEKEYYKNIKAAGLDGVAPRSGKYSADTKIADALWAKKAAREGFAKKKD